MYSISKNVPSSWHMFGYILYFLICDEYHVAVLLVLMSIPDSASRIVSRRPPEANDCYYL